MAPGMTMLVDDNSVENVWVPQNSRSKSDFDIYNELFGNEARFSSYRAYVPESEGNILEKSVLLTLLGIQNEAYAVVCTL